MVTTSRAREKEMQFNSIQGTLIPFLMLRFLNTDETMTKCSYMIKVRAGI